VKGVLIAAPLFIQPDLLELAERILLLSQGKTLVENIHDLAIDDTTLFELSDDPIPFSDGEYDLPFFVHQVNLRPVNGIGYGKGRSGQQKKQRP
jgi:hypothetical protein